MSKKLRIEGDTKPHREMLKARGFKWNPEQGRWWCDVTDWQAARLIDEATRSEEFDPMQLAKNGCRVTVGSVVIWQSETYGASPDSPQTGSVVIRDEYALDAHGNYRPGKQIPGSAPDDRY